MSIPFGLEMDKTAKKVGGVLFVILNEYSHFTASSGKVRAQIDSDGLVFYLLCRNKFKY